METARSPLGSKDPLTIVESGRGGQALRYGGDYHEQSL